eukprot:snap_masked-scaffold_7-processed-gene-1.38-mRNA-1 protein AED:1.00 eAED:1.00 QI:0/-1/0/0/-1/1/1/0/410
MNKNHKTNLKEIPSRKSLKFSKRFNSGTLNSFRLIGDSIGDAVAQDLHYNKGGLVNIHDLLESVNKYDSEEIYKNFIKETSSLESYPKWVNWKKVERGQEIHNMHTPFMGISLLSGSLIGGGQFVNATVVTALAGNISTNPTRRVKETSLLLAAIAFPGALKPFGEAHQSLLRVRLLHSALRTWLPTTNRLNGQRNMVPEGYYVEGVVPINQQDLTITLGIFCYQNLRSLRRMGIKFSPSDIDAYVHMWRLIGWILGIVEELLPKSLEDQEEFMLASMIHQGYPDFFNADELKKFVGAFSDQVSRQTNGVLSKNIVDTYLLQMVRYLNGVDYTGGAIEDLGNYHWSILLTKGLGFFFGTFIPSIPFGFGEKLLINIHTKQLKKQLKRRGTPTGHGAGTGKEIKPQVQSKL